MNNTKRRKLTKKQKQSLYLMDVAYLIVCVCVTLWGYLDLVIGHGIPYFVLDSYLKVSLYPILTVFVLVWIVIWRLPIEAHIKSNPFVAG